MVLLSPCREEGSGAAAVRRPRATLRGGDDARLDENADDDEADEDPGARGGPDRRQGREQRGADQRREEDQDRIPEPQDQRRDDDARGAGDRPEPWRAESE